MSTGPQRILIVEDEPGLIRLLESKLRKAGYDCATVATAEACRTWLAAQTPDLMLLDYSLPDQLAPNLVDELGRGGRLPPFIVITGHGDERVAVEMMKRGARDYLVKDNHIFDRLTPVVQRTLRELEQEHRLAAAEEALRASEERFRAITCSSPDHVLMQDRELRYTFVLNPQLGLTEQDMLGKTDHELFAPADADQLTALKRQVLDTGCSLQVEVPLAAKSGAVGYFSGSYIARRGPDGKVEGLIGYFRNITEQRRAEEALRESEEKFATAFRHSPVPMAIRDFGTDRYVDVNDRCLDMMGYTREEIVGHVPMDIGWMAPEDQEKNLHALSTNGSITDCELHLRRKDGSEVLCSYSTHIIQIGGRPCVLSTSIDITERRRTETQLHQKMAELQASNAELTRFNRVATDRELRMIELKQEINDLCQRAGQPSRYPLGFIEPHAPTGRPDASRPA